MIDRFLLDTNFRGSRINFRKTNHIFDFTCTPQPTTVPTLSYSLVLGDNKLQSCTLDKIMYGTTSCLPLVTTPRYALKMAQSEHFNKMSIHARTIESQSVPARQLFYKFTPFLVYTFEQNCSECRVVQHDSMRFDCFTYSWIPVHSRSESSRTVICAHLLSGKQHKCFSRGIEACGLAQNVEFLDEMPNKTHKLKIKYAA